MDIRDVLETDHGHKENTTRDLRTDDAGPACSQSKPRHGRKQENGPLSMGEAQVCANHEHSPIPQYLLPHQTTALQEMEWSFGVFLQGYSCSQGLIPDFLFIFES